MEISIKKERKRTLYLLMVETRGVSWSLACNGNSAICCGFSTLTNQLQPQLAPARTLDKAYALWVFQFHNYGNKKRLSKVVIFYYWRRGESNPCPKWIKTNVYERRYKFSRTIQGISIPFK